MLGLVYRYKSFTSNLHRDNMPAGECTWSDMSSYAGAEIWSVMLDDMQIGASDM